MPLSQNSHSMVTLTIHLQTETTLLLLFYQDEVHSTSANKTVKHGRLLIFLLLQPFEGHGKNVAFEGTQFTQVYQPYHLLPF